MPVQLQPQLTGIKHHPVSSVVEPAKPDARPHAAIDHFDLCLRHKAQRLLNRKPRTCLRAQDPDHRTRRRQHQHEYRQQHTT